jgi:hypothetical protein
MESAPEHRAPAHYCEDVDGGVSDESSFITGIDLPVDGGVVAVGEMPRNTRWIRALAAQFSKRRRL